MKRLPAAAAAAVLGALAGAIWLIVAYAFDPEVRVNAGGNDTAVTSGFYDAERDLTGTFAWTGERASIALAGLDRRGTWTCSIRARGGRPDPETLPLLTVVVDGVIGARHRMTNDWETIDVEVPAAPGGRGLTLILVTLPTFVPGADDQRELGVATSYVWCRPADRVPMLPPPAAMRRAGVAAAFIGAGVALVGVVPGSAIGAGVAAAAGQALPLSSGTAPYSDFPLVALWLALGVAVVLVIGVAVAERSNERPLRNTAKFAAIFSAAAAYFQLLVLLHPDAPASLVTPAAPGAGASLSGNEYAALLVGAGRQMPEGIALQLLASPLAAFLTPDKEAIAYALAVLANAAAGLWLYGMVTRAWGDRLVAAGATALYHLVPLSFDALATRQSAAFGQSLAVVALALIARSSVRFAWLGPFAGMTALLLAAFLASAGTSVVLGAAVLSAAALYRFRGDRDLASIARRLLAALAVAAAAAAAFYVYSPAARSPSGGQAATAIHHVLWNGFGPAMLLFAAVGSWRLARTRLRDRLSLALAGWVLGAVACWIIGEMSNVALPVALALTPAVAIAAAVGARRNWRGGLPTRLAVLVVIALIVATAVTNWNAWIE